MYSRGQFSTGTHMMKVITPTALGREEQEIYTHTIDVTPHHTSAAAERGICLKASGGRN